ncbi:MAG: NAD(+)/NADH kinase [Candidatus Eisenbacteria bacterium]|nr:NAD(+)/NADH kinase [Candidatus Eisenbacteria bacterium]
MRHLVIVGTRAGRARAAGIHERLRAVMGDDTWMLLLDPSSAEIHALVRLNPGLRAVVVVGGDGTVNRVLRALPVGSPPLAILPAGTANDFASALGVPPEWHEAAEVLRSGVLRHVDLLTVNGRPFVTCGGLGVAAEAADRVARWRHEWRGGNAGAGPGASIGRTLVAVPAARALGALGWIIYPLAAAREFLGPRRLPRLHLSCGGGTWESEALALLFSNQPRFGGRFVGSPGAVHDDGWMDVCAIAAPKSRLGMFRVLARTLQGRAAGLPEVWQARETRVTVESDQPVRFFGDGEILDVGTRFVVEVRPAALRVLAPVAAQQAIREAM